jgi:hypothetical protein
MSLNISRRFPPTIDEPDHVIAFLRDMIPADDPSKKHDFGEVFTPIEIVNDILSQLDTNLFCNPALTWFDPAAGRGIFFIAVYLRLMKGLVHIFPDEIVRKRHIMEKMLFMNEIDVSNVEICRHIFGADANIYCVDTLSSSSSSSLSLSTESTIYDIIIGNPPYQQKVGEKNSASIWDKFVMWSLEHLRDDGYLVFIHPSGWRNSSGKYKGVQRELITSRRHLIYLEIHDVRDGMRVFKCETRYDWYILHNAVPMDENTFTTIKFQDGTQEIVDVTTLEFIPNAGFRKIQELISYDGSERLKILHDFSRYEHRKSWMSATKTDIYMYPCVYMLSTTGRMTCKFSSKRQGHFGVPKLLWSNGSIQTSSSYVDEMGEYGLTQFAYAIVDEPENLYAIQKVFDSIEFRHIMGYCAVGQTSINHRVLELFKRDFWREW